MIPLGAANFQAASRRSLFSSQGTAFRLGECGLTQTGNVDQVAFTNLGRISRSTKFRKWAAGHNAYLKTPSVAPLSLSEIPSITVSRDDA